MKKSPKLFNLFTEEEINVYRFNFVRQTLRRASYRWPWRNIAVQNARVSRGIYKCARCGMEVHNREKHLDHVHPVIDPNRGFVTWGEYILRLLAGPEGWQ